MGWTVTELSDAERNIPELSGGRASFREVLLKDELREAIQEINTFEGQHWLDEQRVNKAVQDLERLGTPNLMEANRQATRLLRKGTVVDGDERLHGGKSQTVHYIDFDRPAKNQFHAISQFRVDLPGSSQFIIPDIVLFVNGIPLGVVECKSPNITNPIGAAINDLQKYSNQRDWVEENEGAENLFHYNLLLIATSFDHAESGAIGTPEEHFMAWKDTSPVPTHEVAGTLDKDRLSQQETLVAGMLRPAHLLKLLQHFTLFDDSDKATKKLVARYQQFRAVHQTIDRLLSGDTRRQDGTQDRRGGIIWHTQGSGKSLTMVFLVRMMRAVAELRRFKVVVVTDRTALQDQLSGTAELSGENLRVADSAHDLKRVLRIKGPGLVFATIQKYQEHEDGAPLPYEPRSERKKAAEGRVYYLRQDSKPEALSEPSEPELYPELNDSEDIVVLIDEAHRSHASTLHANLMRALPNCARIGFTGTPILMGKKKRTHQIFGPFIDTYTIEQAVMDGVTVPIMYEGRVERAALKDGKTLDELFDEAFADKTAQQREEIKQRFATKNTTLNATPLIDVKAEDMLRHYVAHVLPNGMKAQVVATSRQAAVQYQRSLTSAIDALVDELHTMDPALHALSPEEKEHLEETNPEQAFLIDAYAHLPTLERLKAAAVISSDKGDPANWDAWSHPTKTKSYISRFKQHLVHEQPRKEDGLAFLCVCTRLLTGFDAPVAQVMYLDRQLKEHTLLQAIARVNRRYRQKSHGLVVDYYNVAAHLEDALEVYSEEDVRGALTEISEQLPRLRDRHTRVLQLFAENGVDDLFSDEEEAVHLLRDPQLRATFEVYFKDFAASMDIVLPRPEALPYEKDLKQLGKIRTRAANLYRDDAMGTGVANSEEVRGKVRQLIDEHLVAQGIDPLVKPIALLDPKFSDHINRQRSPRAKASEMEHAARHHIKKRRDQDPVYYDALSEKLENILKQYESDWDQLAEQLDLFRKDLKKDEQTEVHGLDSQAELPFYRLLRKRTSEHAAPELGEEEMANLTHEVVTHIRQEIGAVDFWRNAAAQKHLRRWVVRFLDDEGLVPFDQLEATADEILALAKYNHPRLVA